jgi:hypothetical protein
METLYWLCIYLLLVTGFCIGIGKIKTGLICIVSRLLYLIFELNNRSTIFFKKFGIECGRDRFWETYATGLLLVTINISSFDRTVGRKLKQQNTFECIYVGVWNLLLFLHFYQLVLCLPLNIAFFRGIRKIAKICRENSSFLDNLTRIAITLH